MQIRKLLMMGVVIATLTTSIIPVSAAPTEVAPMPVVALDANDKAVLKLLFDAEYYASQYPDLAAAFGDNEEALFNHFCVHGINEGRSLSKDFHVAAYKSAYKDLQDAFGDDVMAYYTHYVLTKDVENRVVTTVKKAQEEGITVTNFAGERVVENADGKVLTGTSAEKTIQRSKSKKSSSSSASSSSSSNSSGNSNAGSGNTNPAAPTVEEAYVTTSEGIFMDVHIARGTSRAYIVEMIMSDDEVVQSNPSEWTWTLEADSEMASGTSISSGGVITVAEDEPNSMIKIVATNKEDESFSTYSDYVIVTVDEVPVTPAIVSVEKGETQQFSADVVLSSGTDVLGVTWSMCDKSVTENGSTITEDGLLTVSLDETGTYIEVWARSKLDNSVMGIAMVTLVEPTS